MEESSTRNKVKAIVGELLGFDEVKTATLAGANKLSDDLGADSLDHVAIITEVEDKFGLESTADDVMAKVVTIDDLVQLVDQALAAKSAPAPIPAPAE